MGVHRDRNARADALGRRMPSAPPQVVARMQAHLRHEDLGRGMVAAMEDFYARLAAAGLPPARATPEIFAAVGSSRSRLRTLLKGLVMFDPYTPLAPASTATKDWDRWLNARYNSKPQRRRRSRRVAALPEVWPAEWREAIPALDRTVRAYGRVMRPLARKTRDTTLQAVGMLVSGTAWAVARDVDLPADLSPDLVEAFYRYLSLERCVAPGTVVDYLERLQMFFLRGKLLDSETDAVISELIALHSDLAGDIEPAKRAVLRAFRQSFDLGDVLRAAATAGEKARALPGHTTAALRLRQKGVAYALLVNTADRQGDLRTARIGREFVRGADGLWRHDIRQKKGGRRKELEALWPITCALLDDHLLGDRPVWLMEARLDELDGANLLTLSEENILNRGFLNSRLSMDFPVTVPSTEEEQPEETSDGEAKDGADNRERQRHLSGHLIRTLITDAIRRTRCDAVWAAQQLLGHSDRYMHETYRSDFDEAGAVGAMAEELDRIARQTDGSEAGA